MLMRSPFSKVIQHPLPTAPDEINNLWQITSEYKESSDKYAPLPKAAKTF
jgi:hypothetical protein